MPSLPNAARSEAVQKLREVLTLMSQPSERELAGEDEVHLTRSDLADLLREAYEKGWGAGFRHHKAATSGS